MTIRRSRLGGLLGLMTMAAALAAPAATLAASGPTSAAAASAATTCATAGHWPASVQALPSLWHVGASAGDYIWHDGTGWHLRVTHRGTSRVVFSGRIVASTPMTATPVRLEPGDAFVLSTDKKTLTYRFVNYGRIDGLNIRTDCAHRITFGGSMSGAKLGIGRIWVGHGNHHPLQNPFAVTRVS